MATSTIYKNSNGDTITSQQLARLNNYQKILIVDNVVKKIEYYEDNLMNQVSYYKEDSESDNNILSQFSGIKIIQILERDSSGNFQIERSAEFIDGELAFKEIDRFDQSGNLICSQTIDTDTGLPVLEKTEKYMYDEGNNKKYCFMYDENGDLEYISGFINEYPFGNHTNTIPAIDISTYLPDLLSESPYYKNATFNP